MKHIPLSVPNLSGEEKTYVDTAVETEWVSTGGPYVKEFERSVADFVNADDACACQSGTAGLHLALMESGVQPGEKVLVADLTFFATVNPIVYCFAEPVFIGCDDSLCMDPAALERFCAEECEMKDGALYEKRDGKRVRAVVPVHIFGNLCDMDAIMRTAESYGLFVIEDACEALGSRFTAGRYAGKHSGTVGDIGVFSFNGNKIITTGGGGMIVAREQSKLGHMRYKSQQSKDDAVRFIHGEVGYNYRLTNLQAALGIAQMKQLSGFIETKKRNYELYGELGVELLPFSVNCAPNYWFYSYWAGDRREYLMEELKKRGIDSRPIWELMHRLKPFLGFESYSTDRAEYWHRGILNIPCSTNLSQDDVRAVAAAIKEIMA